MIAGGAFTVVDSIVSGQFAWVNLAANVIASAGFFIIGDSITGMVSKAQNIFARTVAPAALRSIYAFALNATGFPGMSFPVVLMVAGTGFAVFLGSRWAAEELERRMS